MTYDEFRQQQTEKLSQRECAVDLMQLKCGSGAEMSEKRCEAIMRAQVAHATELEAAGVGDGWACTLDYWRHAPPAPEF